MTFLGRDASDVEALQLDRYLDALLSGEIDLAGADRGGDVPAAAIKRAADRLRRDLTRVHPSFRFEERLAARLAAAAGQMRLPAAAGAEGTFVPAGVDGQPFRLTLVEGEGESDREVGDRARPLIIGGAMASAALSIAGAAYVAWRRTRPPLSPMVRAARAARRAALPGRTGTAPRGPHWLDG